MQLSMQSNDIITRLEAKYIIEGIGAIQIDEYGGDRY